MPEDLFCSFELTAVSAGEPVRSTQHVCGEDIYVGELTVLSNDAWDLKYTVTGPRTVERSAQSFNLKVWAMVELVWIPWGY